MYFLQLVMTSTDVSHSHIRKPCEMNLRTTKWSIETTRSRL